MLIDTVEYAASLKRLWSDVFGDSEEYIGLMFDKGYTPSECFGEIVDGQVVSALYLLRCSIISVGTAYEGRYLYAAATLNEYRNKGIMGGLINESKDYVRENNIPFIALVPASEKLYGYYAKYGFDPTMYNYASTVLRDGSVTTQDEIISDSDSLIQMRSRFKGDAFAFCKSEMSYALSCLNFAGYRVYKNTEDSYYIADNNRSEIIEYITSKKNFKENTDLFLSKLRSGTVISSPYNLGEFCDSKMQKFGMIYTDCEKIAKRRIYMNIALD